MRSGAAPHVPSHIIARLWRTSVRIGEERFRNNASGGIRFEFTTFHISEIGNAVFQEIEERHYRGDEFIRKNVIAVYRFNAQQKIIHLDIYEQARDSGQWIIQAAQEACLSHSWAPSRCRHCRTFKQAEIEACFAAS